MCLTDRRGRTVQPLRRTASWGFVRLHEGRATPPTCYGDTALRSWVRRVAELWALDEDVHVFFNNDGHGCAVRDAARFAAHARRAGWATSRVPLWREAPVR